MRAAELAAHGLDLTASRRLANVCADAISRSRDWLATDAHDLVTLGSERYPPGLAELDDAPLALWVIGNDPGLLLGPQIAVVGSRNPTTGGRITAERFARRLSECGITVTSGLAVGIDAAGHAGGLAGVGSTIAVLGSGIDLIYPRQNGSLAERIAREGLVVSEYPPGTSVRPHHFPRRNRIIAALTLGTLVVEAARKSGSLITAKRALEYGRDVFAIPGSIHSALSKGCHWLLRQGAKLVEDVDDILVEIAPGLEHAMRVESPTEANREPLPSTNAARRSLVESLDFTPVTIEQLVPDTGLTAAELSSMLLHLEMEGTVEALPGGRFCRLTKRGR